MYHSVSAVSALPGGSGPGLGVGGIVSAQEATPARSCCFPGLVYGLLPSRATVKSAYTCDRSNFHENDRGPLFSCSEGLSRQFGFVGFRTPEEAQAALQYFNCSFIDTYRLACEVRGTPATEQKTLCERRL